MKTRILSEYAASCSAILLSVVVVPVQGTSLLHPARFGVINIIPNEYSFESSQDAEPSLAVGLNVNYGKMAAHTFAPTIYTSGSSGDAPWTVRWGLSDLDATMDWSSGGTFYLALDASKWELQVRKSSDPTATAFTEISSIIRSGGPDQPWVRSVTVNGLDHIFVGYNDLTRFRGATATVHYSLDGGSSWYDNVIERVYPSYGQDSPAVRLALSSDGKKAYALFQRWYSTDGPDRDGAVVLVRDDDYGGSGFGDLGNGTLVADNIVLPWGITWSAQRLGCNCDVAVHPYRASQVYVAYTEIVSGFPVIRLESSADSGMNFDLVASFGGASLPALAVAADGTVGLLYVQKNGNNLEVHFFKAIFGNFTNPKNMIDRTLAWFPDNYPVKMYDPYIGDYFGLKAVGHNFFGTFCASNDPQPSHFPSGVFYQRNVKFMVNNIPIIKNNFQLGLQSGTLADLAGHDVPISIDPFVFYDIGGSVAAPFPPHINWIFSSFFSLGDPFSGLDHLNWPVLPSSEPQLELQTADAPGPGAHWTVPTTSQGVSIVQTNGQNFATFVGADPQRFFRLQQSLVGSRLLLFASADDHGTLTVPPGGGVLGPDGVMTNAAFSNPTFIATPTNNYYVDKWYLDGVAVQSNAPSLTVSNITSEHTLVVTFSPSNDVALTLFDSPGDEGPTETGKTNTYVVEVENKGLNPLTGVSMMDTLDPTVEFVSATTSQGTVVEAGGQVVANIGALDPGELVTVNIQFVPFFATTILNTANVVCDQPEPDLANNSATISTTVIDPVIITNQPAPITVRAGATATFNVGASGTPPFTYQWFFNGTNLLNNATSATLTLTNVTAPQAGAYSVSVLQVLGPEDIEGDNSSAATLTVQ